MNLREQFDGLIDEYISRCLDAWNGPFHLRSDRQADIDVVKEKLWQIYSLANEQHLELGYIYHKSHGARRERIKPLLAAYSALTANEKRE